MRIVSYNILNGGVGREDLLAQVLEGQRPEVIALVEADDPQVVEGLAARFKMHFTCAPSGGKHAGALLSVWPIVSMTNHALQMESSWMNAFFEAHVLDPSGNVWPIAVVHFAAHASEEREQLRESQLEVVLRKLAPLKNRPHLLAGDFNSNSPVQNIDLARCKPRTQEEWAANGGKIPRRVIQRLLDVGYVDSLHVHSPSIAESAGTFTTEFPGQRIDYLFIHGIDSIQVRSAWVESTPLAREASDHFPVGLEISLRTRAD